MAAFHVRVPGLVPFLLLVAVSTAVMALPAANEESDAGKIAAKATKTVDYRSNKCMPPIATKFIRATEQCAFTFWAFPAIVMAEYLDCTSSKKKVLRTFSAEQIIECALPDFQSSCATFNFKKVTDALDYVIYNGVALDADYIKLEDASATAGYHIGLCKKNTAEAAYKLNKGYRTLKPFDEKNMARVIRENGPILATVYLDKSKLDDIKGYATGVIFDSDKLCGKSVADFSILSDIDEPTDGVAFPVTLVGYTTMEGVQVWIGRADWFGSAWGTAGYFYLKRGVNACNIALNPIRVLG